MLVESDNPHQKKKIILPYTVDFLVDSPIFYRSIKDFASYKKYSVYQFVIKN